MAVGDRFVRRHNAARTSTSNTTAADIAYDTAVISETGYSWSSPEVTVSDAGLYLTIFDIGQVDLASTRAVGTLVPSVNTTDQTRFRATHRYLRNSNGSQEGASIGMCILNLSANDDVKVRNPGALTPTDAVGSYATNSTAGGGLQLIRLNDGNFTHLERTVDAAEIGRSAINTTRPWLDASGTWTTITYNSEVQDDDGLYPGSGGDVTLAANKKYMVVWGVTPNEDTNTNRHTYVARLQIDSANVQTGSSYQRNAGSNGPPICGMYLHETGGSTETLRLQCTHEVETVTFTPDIADAYLQVIELPDSAEWVHVDNGATDSMVSDLAGLTTWYDTPLSSTFRADGDSNLSLDGANDAVQNDSGASLPVLAIGWHRWDRDATTSANRKNPWTRWDNGGTATYYGVAGAFSRGQQSDDDTWQAHYCSAATMDLANGADLSFQANDESNAANSDMGIYASTNRHFLGVQVLNLNTLDAGISHTVTPGAGSITITGQAPAVSISSNIIDQPGTGSLVLTGHIPSRGTGLRLEGLAPAISIDAGSEDHTAEPGSGALALLGQAPTVTTTANIVVQIPSASLSLSSDAPEINISIVVAPGVGNVALTGEIPTLDFTANHIRAPPSGDLALSGNAPSLGFSWTVYPPNGSLVLTGHAPATGASDDKTAEPSAGSLALTGYAPSVTVSDNLEVSPDTGALALTGYLSYNYGGPGLRLIGYEPTIVVESAGFSAEPTPGSLTLTGYTPTLSIDSGSSTAEPNSGNLLLAGEIPIVDVSDNKSVFPGTGDIVLTGYIPGLTYSWTVYPGTGALTLAGESPVAVTDDNKTAQPPAGSINLTGLAPTVATTELKVVNPDAGGLSLTGDAPTVGLSDNKIAQPLLGAIDLAGQTPATSLTADHFIDPEFGSLALTGEPPITNTGDNKTTQPPAEALSLTGLVPSVGLTDSKVVNPAAGVLSFAPHSPAIEIVITGADASLGITGYQPTINIDSGDSTVLPGTGSLTLTGEVPVTNAGDNKTVQVPAGSINLSGQAPAITENNTVSPAAGALNLAGYPNYNYGGPGLRLIGYEPSTAIEATTPVVTPNAASISLNGQTPTINLTDNVGIPVPAGALSVTGETPNILVSTTVAPGLGVLSLNGQQPTISRTDNHFALLPAGIIALSGHSPVAIAGDNKVAQPATASLALAGHAPSVAVSDNKIVTPGAGSLALTGHLSYNYGGPGLRVIGYEPSISIATATPTVEPGAGSLGLSGLTPTIDVTGENINVSPGTGALTFERHSPAIEIVIFGADASLQLTGYAPSVAIDPSGDFFITPNTGSLSLIGYQPVVGIDWVVDPTDASLTLAGHAPVAALSDNKTAAPDPGVLSITGELPSISVTNFKIAIVPDGSLALTGYPPSLAYDWVVKPAQGVLDLQGRSPVVDTGISLQTGALTLTGHQPTAALALAPNYVECVLVDRTGRRLPNLKLLSWAWFDDVDPANFIAPVDQGEIEMTDEKGLIEVVIPNTTLSAGQFGTLVLRSDSGNLFGAYNLEVLEV